MPLLDTQKAVRGKIFSYNHLVSNVFLPPKNNINPGASY